MANTRLYFRARKDSNTLSKSRTRPTIDLAAVSAAVRRREQGSASSTDSETGRRQSTDDDVEVFAAAEFEAEARGSLIPGQQTLQPAPPVGRQQSSGGSAGEGQTLGRQQSRSVNLVKVIKDLIQEGILVK